MCNPSISATLIGRLKSKHRGMWASGNYHAVVADIISELGPMLVNAAGIRPGDLVLDVAAGSGNVAIPAAQAGARVIAADLTPELMEVGESWAAEVGVRLSWEIADAEALPYGDGEFDTVLSCLGVMFAPHHQAAANELVRVCRPGGTIGLIAWTPTGFIGQMFATMKPYAPPPPPGAQQALLWGDEDHVRKLLGNRVEQVHTETRAVRVTHFATPEAFRDYFKINYGPTISTYRAIADDPERVAALDRDLVELARGSDAGMGSTVLDWECLLFTARKSG
jgi:ubiquinone/menaquinone biosynthesis C-methylase UbiE